MRRTFAGWKRPFEIKSIVTRADSALRRWQFWILASLLTWSCPEVAHAQVLLANFDDLTVGSVGKSFTDGGITFSNLDTRGGFYNNFSTQFLSAGADFSPPNCLGFGYPN